MLNKSQAPCQAPKGALLASLQLCFPAFSTLELFSSHGGLLGLCSCPRAFAPVGPCAWNVFPPGSVASWLSSSHHKNTDSLERLFLVQGCAMRRGKSLHSSPPLRHLATVSNSLHRACYHPNFVIYFFFCHLSLPKKYQLYEGRGLVFGSLLGPQG